MFKDKPTFISDEMSSEIERIQETSLEEGVSGRDEFDVLVMERLSESLQEHVQGMSKTYPKGEKNVERLTSLYMNHSMTEWSVNRLVEVSEKTGNLSFDIWSNR